MTGLGNIDDVYRHYLLVIEENQQLKELLKEIRSLWKGTVCMPDSQEQVRDILTKIDNVIGEKK